MRGMHFDTGKTFLLPSAMIGIRQLVKLFKSFEGIVGLVTGHTDRQGRDGVDASRDPPAVEFNRALSNERADVIKAFLLDDADAWMNQINERAFGTRTSTRLTVVVDAGRRMLECRAPLPGSAYGTSIPALFEKLQFDPENSENVTLVFRHGYLTIGHGFG
jgi:hypothetical protein